MFANGDIYDGNFMNDKFQGQGTFIWKNRDMHHGEFKYGLKHGKGKLLKSDGTGYEGSWKNDKEDGEGIYTTQEHGPKKSLWKEGVFLRYLD